MSSILKTDQYLINKATIEYGKQLESKVLNPAKGDSELRAAVINAFTSLEGVFEKGIGEFSKINPETVYSLPEGEIKIAFNAFISNLQGSNLKLNGTSINKEEILFDRAKDIVQSALEKLRSEDPASKPSGLKRKESSDEASPVEKANKYLEDHEERLRLTRSIQFLAYASDEYLKGDFDGLIMMVLHKITLEGDDRYSEETLTLSEVKNILASAAAKALATLPKEKVNVSILDLNNTLGLLKEKFPGEKDFPELSPAQLYSDYTNNTFGYNK